YSHLRGLHSESCFQSEVVKVNNAASKKHRPVIGDGAISDNQCPAIEYRAGNLGTVIAKSAVDDRQCDSIVNAGSLGGRRITADGVVTKFHRPAIVDGATIIRGVAAESAVNNGQRPNAAVKDSTTEVTMRILDGYVGNCDRSDRLDIKHGT